MVPAWAQMLGKPAVYLTIRHERKTFYEIVVPIGATMLSALAYWAMPDALPLAIPRGGSTTVILQIQEFVKNLPGFFIAALAAVVSLSKDVLDVPFKGTSPLLRDPDPVTGIRTLQPLQRRRFLSLLFGYLTLLSIAYYVVLAASLIFAPSMVILIATLPAWAQALGKFLAALTIFLFFWHLVAVTLLGLYYLSYRIFRD